MPAMSRYPFPSQPAGWFGLALSDELPAGEVITREAFGREIVLFRDEAGNARALDPFCPHLGAHLGHGGTVVGDSIKCPFHGFQFNGQGKCVAIGTSGKIPPRAELRSWEVREVDGIVIVWHHPTGEPPSFEIPSYHQEGWTDLMWHTWGRLKAHPQETSENSVDLAHFKHVHGYEDVAIVKPIEIDDATLRISYSMKRDLSSLGMVGQFVESVFNVRVHGLGYSVVEVDVATFNTETRTYVICTPLNDDEVILRGGATMKKMANEQMTEQISKLVFDGFVADVEQDFAIWENKAYLTRPVLSEGDGPIGAYRKYCRQFYPQQDAAE